MRLSIDGKKVVEHDGIHPLAEIREGKVKLTAGEHDFRLEYFQAAGEAELYVAWRGAGFLDYAALEMGASECEDGAQAKKKDDKPPGMPLVVEQGAGRFIATSSRAPAIAASRVGYPGGFNIAWSAETMNLALALARRVHRCGAALERIAAAAQQPPLGYDVLATRRAMSPRPSPSSRARTRRGRQSDKRRARRGLHVEGLHARCEARPDLPLRMEGVKVTDRFDVDGDALARREAHPHAASSLARFPPGALFSASRAATIEAATVRRSSSMAGA